MQEILMYKTLQILETTTNLKNINSIIEGGAQFVEVCQTWKEVIYIYIYTYVLGSKLLIFPYNRGWSSTQ